MKIYICEECEKPCFIHGNNPDVVLCTSKCKIKNPAFRMTEDYEIRKKDRFTMNEDAKDFLISSLKEAVKAKDELISALREKLENTYLKVECKLDENDWDKIAESIVKYKSDKEGLHSYSREHLDSVVPNCSLCKWNREELSADDNSNIHSCDCMAMGGRDANSCYGTDECRALYGVGR